MAETIIDYVRCPNCSYVYEATEDRCPSCGQLTVISESEVQEKVFNIID